MHPKRDIILAPREYEIPINQGVFKVKTVTDEVFVTGTRDEGHKWRPRKFTQIKGVENIQRLHQRTNP